LAASLGFLLNEETGGAAGGGVKAGSVVSSPRVFLVKEVVDILRGIPDQAYPNRTTQSPFARVSVRVLLITTKS
jgi:hypothetical protein